jgi:hypothetical protein
MIQANAAERSEKIGNSVIDTGISKGHIILVNFITDAVKRCGYHAEQYQHSRVTLDSQGLVSPVE